MEQGLSIGDVAALTGVSTSALRAWERRYRIVEPHRSSSGIRRYDQAQVAVIRRMHELVEAGTPPRRAAAMAQEGAAGDAISSPLDDAQALVRAAHDPDQQHRILDEAFALATFEHVLDRWLMPSLQALGQAWADGTLDVAEEHLVSTAIQHKMASIYAATPSRGPRVLVGLPPGSRHELPALAMATCLRRQHLDAVFLGPDVPAESWGVAVRLLQPRMAVIAPLVGGDVEAAEAAAACCHQAGLAEVHVGGRVAHQVRNASTLPNDIPAAAVLLAKALRRRRRPVTAPGLPAADELPLDGPRPDEEPADGPSPASIAPDEQDPDEKGTA